MAFQKSAANKVLRMFMRLVFYKESQYYHIKGFDLLQEDLSALLAEYSKVSRAFSYEKNVYPLKRQNQSIPGRNILVFVYISTIISFLTWR